MDDSFGQETQFPIHPHGCRLIVRKEKHLGEVTQFVSVGLEIGQQVIVLGGPACLKDLARRLNDSGLRAESLLRNGRLTFLTAPQCLSQIAQLGGPWQRNALHRNGAMLRWVSDWSWAYAQGLDPNTVFAYQRLVHDFVSSVGALSVCTVHCEKMERGSLLAIVAGHRRALRATTHPA